MKRIIGLLVVILALHACKKKMDDTAPRPFVANPGCITLEDYDRLTTKEEKVAWLRNSGKLVCDAILYAREEEHRVPTEEITIIPGTIPLEMNWTEFKKFVGATVYEKYVGFEVDSIGNVTNLRLVPAYSETEDTYSVPMYRSIGLKYKLQDVSELEFLRVMVKDVLHVVVRFKDEKDDYVYYDVSNIPL